MARTKIGLACLLTGGLLVAGCGASGAGATGSGTGPTASTSVVTSGTALASGTATASTAVEAGEPSWARTAAGTRTSALPGAAWAAGPAAGRSLVVMGVAEGGTLAVRSGPGADRPVVTTLPALGGGAVATGRARLLQATGVPAVWVEVTVHGVTGWAQQGHLALSAHPVDLTAEARGRLGAAHLTAATITALGTAVAQAYASTEPPSTIVVTVAPTTADPHRVTLDVIGLADDAVAGQRLRVTGAPSADGVTLVRVEATPFCSRGLSSTGTCV